MSDFREKTQIAVRVRFVNWTEAIRYLTDYVSVPTNPPLVAEIGDSWAAYFRSLGVVRYEKRFYRDVRVLWYWRDLVRPEELLDGKSFLEACRRLTESAPTELKAPLAIATGVTFNPLHDLAIFLYNAGVETLISTERRFGVLPWKEARFAGEAGQRATRFLIELARQGYLDLPDSLEVDVARDFMDRRYAMIIQRAWVGEWARKRWGDEWRSKLGVTLPPRIGGPVNTTMMGGSFLMVLDPGSGQPSDRLEPARRLVDYFSSSDVQLRLYDDWTVFPAQEDALAQVEDLDLFAAAVENARAYPEIPEWALVVENIVTRDDLHAFWKRLATVSKGPASNPDEEEAREELIMAALKAAQFDINQQLSPGHFALFRPWLGGLLGGLFLVALGVMGQRHAERRRSEERLRISEERYRDLYDNAPDMFCSVDATNGKIIHCNKTLAEKSGFTIEEIRHRSVFDLYHPDGLEEVKRVFELFRKTGEVRDVELPIRRRDGEKLWVSVNVSGVRDEDGNVLHSRAVLRDITERRAIEEQARLWQQELAHVSRVATVGELTASLAHELNQPLAAIVTNAQAVKRMLRSSSPEAGEVEEALIDITQDGKRASQVIARLRALLKKEAPEHASLDLNAAIREIADFLKRDSVLRNLKIEQELTSQLPSVQGDRIQLQQVILNLVLNASEAMGQASGVSDPLLIRTLLDSQGNVLVTVRDHGSELGSEELERVFDPFYTTKPAGMGMGLSINRTILEAHGGRIWAENNTEGPGCTFCFRLPAE